MSGTSTVLGVLQFGLQKLGQIHLFVVDLFQDSFAPLQLLLSFFLLF